MALMGTIIISLALKLLQSLMRASCKYLCGFSIINSSSTRSKIICTAAPHTAIHTPDESAHGSSEYLFSIVAHDTGELRELHNY